MRRIALALLLLLLTGANKPIARHSATPRSPAELQSRLLAAHNKERATAGAPPLVWSDRLAGDAAAWARHLATINRLDHQHQELEGENLWWGTRGDYSPEEMVGSWIDERRWFKAGTFPNVSTTGNWVDVGHYTQLIWRDTREVGCAIAPGRKRDILVCRYAPLGNMDDERVTNGR